MTTPLAAKITHHELTRSAQVLIGICSGLVADGQLNDMEIGFLSTWLADNKDVTAIWPGDSIANRISAITEDGVISTEERAELLSLLSTLCGNEFSETGSATVAGPGVPFDAVPVAISSRSFCLTGTFFYGTRPKCEKLIHESGGEVSQSVTGHLDYLVVGGGCSEQWANETYGRKIEAAMERKKRYGQPAIISEAAWMNAIKETTRA